MRNAKKKSDQSICLNETVPTQNYPPTTKRLFFPPQQTLANISLKDQKAINILNKSLFKTEIPAVKLAVMIIVHHNSSSCLSQERRVKNTSSPQDRLKESVLCVTPFRRFTPSCGCLTLFGSFGGQVCCCILLYHTSNVYHDNYLICV